MLKIYGDHGVRNLSDEDIEAVKRKLIWEENSMKNLNADQPSLLKALEYYKLFKERLQDWRTQRQAAIRAKDERLRRDTEQRENERESDDDEGYITFDDEGSDFEVV